MTSILRHVSRIFGLGTLLLAVSMVTAVTASSVEARGTAAHPTKSVSIKGFAFSPKSLTIKVGTTVKWTNKDAVIHTVTFSSARGVPTSSKDIAQGKTFQRTFSKAGTFHYHCKYHPFMKGTIKVTH
ncbi:MAG TPA: cupredoxin domain-containing protein [Chloroflexota bacterium]|nr:cupredoxin domain-containing protein [Chloroflexota bacterium]